MNGCTGNCYQAERKKGNRLEKPKLKGMKQKRINRPTPPDELDGESLLEWDRICDELKMLGQLNKADRAIMTLHCQTWAVYRSAQQAVNQFGAVVKWPNGIPGPGPFYRVMRETAIVLRGTLKDLGLTPDARGLATKKEQEEESADLEI